MVVVAGMVSSAALVNGFSGYLGQFLELDRYTLVLVTCLLLTVIAAWGIMESVTIAALNAL
jgi:hypothetical protein